jgi:DNA-binding MarR family transcriptional regulator
MMNDFEKHLNTLLVEIFNSILKYEERYLKKKHSLPITVSEAHIIEFVGRFKEPSIGQLATLLGITPPSATVAVKKLERRGILTRVQNSDDGRKAHVRLTDIGQRIDRVHSLFHRQLVRAISKQFNNEEQKVLMVAVQTISQFFRDIEIKEKGHSYEF